MSGLKLIYLSGLLIFAQATYAIKIPISAERLGKPGRENSSYGYLDSILINHKEFNYASTYFILLYGAGILTLVPSLVAESTHTTPWGREYNRARKLKDLIIASSNNYLDGTDQLIGSKKNRGSRRNTYNKNQDLFVTFYDKIAGYYREHSLQDPPSIEDIKSLLNRANQTGILCSHGLLKEIFKHDSFDALRLTIISGQLEDRVKKIEDILEERKTREDALDKKLQGLNNELFQIEGRIEPFVVTDALKKQYDPWYKQLYAVLDNKISQIPEFNF